MLSKLTALPTTTLAAVAIVGLVLTVYIFQRPQRGVLITAALVPLHGMLLTYSSGEQLAVWKEGLLGLTLLCALASARWREVRIPNAPWLIPFGILVIVGVLSAFATLPGTASIMPLKITFFYGVTIPIIMWLHPFDRKDRDHLISIMMVMALGTGLFGIWQLTVDPEQLVDMGFQYNREIRTAGSMVRAFSTFGAPFPFALYEMATLLICGCVAVADPRRLRNLIFLILTPVYLAAMSTGIVRGAFLGLIAGLIWIGLRRYPRILTWLAGTTVVAAVVVMQFFPNILKVFTSSSSLTERSNGWSQMIESVLSHPTGIGLGSTGSAAAKVAEAKHATAIPYQPDNYYMKLLIELGPIGLWAFGAVLVSAILVSQRVANDAYTKEDRAFALGVTASLIAAAAGSMVATYFEIFPMDVYFWITISAVASMAFRPQTAGSTEPDFLAIQHTKEFAMAGRPSRPQWRRAAPRKSTGAGPVSTAARKTGSAPTTSTQSASGEVTYEVTGDDVYAIIYYDEHGEVASEQEPVTPWRLQLTATDGSYSLSVVSAETATCSISAGGQLLASASGAAAACTAQVAP